MTKNKPRSVEAIAARAEHAGVRLLMPEDDMRAERQEVEALIARFKKRGRYAYDDLVAALATVNKFAKEWPDLNPGLVESLAESLTETDIDVDDAASLGDLIKLSEWLTKLHGACDAEVQKWQADDDADAASNQQPIVIRKKKRRQPFVQHEARA